MKKLGSVTGAQQFDAETLEIIFLITREIEELVLANDKNLLEILKGKIMISLFYEASTRTRLSFESAMLKLGGSVIGTENAGEFSSATKGESLEDSIRVCSGYGDVIVLRHPKDGSSKRAAKFSKVPVINAGDGAGQHPTQALLDIYTIKKEFGEINELKIAMAGDLLNGRTVRSLCYLLAKHFPENFIYFVSPQQVRMKDDIKQYLNEKMVSWKEVDDFDEILGEVDIIYQTRVQKERFEGDSALHEEVVEASRKLIITKDLVSQMKETAIIMHPLPRLTEISYEVDKDPRARYFEQAQNGLYARMAMLKMILVGY